MPFQIEGGRVLPYFERGAKGSNGVRDRIKLGRDLGVGLLTSLLI
jgi:hypothetical protein